MLWIRNIPSINRVAKVTHCDLGKTIIQEPIHGRGRKQADPVGKNTGDSPDSYNQASQPAIEVLLQVESLLAAEYALINDPRSHDRLGNLEANRSVTMLAGELLPMFPCHVHIFLGTGRAK